MTNHRMSDNYPLRNVVVSGNLMAAALEHTELYEKLEINSLIQTWAGAIERAPEGLVPEHLAKSGNSVANGLTHRSTFPPYILDKFIADWRISIDQLRHAVATQQEAA